MSGSSSSTGSQPKIIELIVEAGKKAFDPTIDATSKALGVQEYEKLIDSTETWTLLPALNALIKPSVLPSWLRDPLLQTLTLLPLRQHGVRGTMEFVFSVHPSNVGKTPEGDAASQKQGASITHEAVAVAARLLSSVPASMTPQAWFEGISGQLFSLMDGQAGPDMARTAAQVVGYGILGKKQYGAPGSPGWNAFVQPLVQDLNPSLKSNSDQDSTIVKQEDEEIVDLSKDHVLVTAQSLKISLQRLNILVLSNPSPGLCKRLLRPVLVQIWVLGSWPGPLPTTEQDFVKPARTLLQAYLRLFGTADTVAPFIRNLLCKGSADGTEKPWQYHLKGKGDIEAIEPRGFAQKANIELNWNELEDKATNLVDCVTAACSATEVSSIFLSLLRRWIQTAGKQTDDVKIDIRPEDEMPESPVQDLVEVTVLQKLMDKAPEKLVSHFDQLLELVCQVLSADSQSRLGDDLLAVVLSLLNLVITAPTFQKSHIKPEELKIVESTLDRLSKEDRAQVSPTARNLALLLKYRDEVEQSDEPTSTPSSRQIEDRRTYSLAMNYITGGSDNPAPVVSEGLNLLSGLIMADSPILDIPAVTVLLSNLLENNDDYINLRVIKVYTQLANKHPKSAVQELLDHYLDSQEKSATDVRLRFGEALLQVVQRLGETFAGDVAQQVCETLLSIAGRRGYRPKTMAKQAREEKRQKMKKGKDDEDEDMDLDEDVTEEDKAKNDILVQILQGWESKRGSEDVRVRTSALSIFGTALETNIGGIGPTLVSASVDLCINILAMERELETAILRRAAILNVLSFVRALDAAKESGRRLGFGLTDESREDILRTLQYVAGTDNDGLVQQHAKDVIESLENWQMASMLPTQSQSSGPALTNLAGLHVNPSGTLVDASGRPRPRIEEVE
ncbi:RNA polymerase II assembly factor RTP1 [Fusarium albosuccineum]|uniref:RNA polymerase II assembly factor RTP1 n=1 Tax=Fusarium albosuccineum TaxID=1237068 RepID=A0A8H4L4B7_9HYPO|nr:RNA polymerase II assembly factor RTP1 [Fusarium albosuccineum]